MMASGNSSLTVISPTACGGTLMTNSSLPLRGGGFFYLVPQVFGGAAYVSVEVGHVDKLGDSSFSGCLGDILRDGHEHVLKAEVPEHRGQMVSCEYSIGPRLEVLLNWAHLVSHSRPTRLMTTLERSSARLMDSLFLGSHSCTQNRRRESVRSCTPQTPRRLQLWHHPP